MFEEYKVSGEKRSSGKKRTERKCHPYPETELPGLYVPGALRTYLLEDHAACQEEEWAASLPFEVTARDVLEQYKRIVTESYCESLRLPLHDVHNALVGIEELFNAALGRILLYLNERTQYSLYLETFHRRNSQPPRPARIFGCIHLVRLLVKLPQLLNDSDTDPQSATILLRVSNDLLGFIADNASTFIQRY